MPPDLFRFQSFSLKSVPNYVQHIYVHSFSIKVYWWLIRETVLSFLHCHYASQFAKCVCGIQNCVEYAYSFVNMIPDHDFVFQLKTLFLFGTEITSLSVLHFLSDFLTVYRQMKMQV